MVECISNLDNIFQALADATRRDILRRVSHSELSISSLAKPYTLSFATIAKHVSVLEDARLVAKRRQGKQQIVSVVPATLDLATTYLEQYEKIWHPRFTALDTILKE